MMFHGKHEHVTVEICCDAEPLTALLAELSDLFETLELPAEIGKRFVRLFKSAEQLGLVDFYSFTTPGTGEVIVRLHPGDRLLRFAAALRAGECDLALIESASGHGGPPCVNG